MGRVFHSAFCVIYPRFSLFRYPQRRSIVNSSRTMSSNIEEAVQHVFSSRRHTIRPTARAWNVSSSTLSRRINGGCTRREGHSSQQLLSPVQEEILVSWILEQERLGYAPTHQRVREFAARIRACAGEDPQIGKNWLGWFFQRNPTVRTKFGRKIDSYRVQNTQPEVLRP
jgi:Tc5 transposase DNA-binding domain